MYGNLVYADKVLLTIKLEYPKLNQWKIDTIVEKNMPLLILSNYNNYIT